ncbi:MAG TPA: outer membrane beta-barrel protein [Chthoniobacterales bacterium]|jgi:high affinity Mn2+ porin|nr:outer membrane beta-barrel protein [Chthoniobacterales bacterium]
MKRFIALTFIVLALVGLTQIGSAGPERMSSKEIAPVPTPECDWTGWYIGVHFGGGNAKTDWQPLDDLQNEVVATQDVPFIFGGLQVGYNRQVNNWLVVGWELTASGGGLDDTKSMLVDSGEELDHYKSESHFMATRAGRIGFTSMNNHALFYVRGGMAATQWEFDFLHDENPGLIFGGSAEFDHWNESGWTVDPVLGIGIEYMFNCHWSMKMEYNHIFITDFSVQGTLHEDFESPEGDHGYQYQIKHDTVQLGVNYHF